MIPSETNIKSQKKIMSQKLVPASTKKLKQQKLQNQKEESLREILGFFLNQVEVKKFLKKTQLKEEGIQDIEEKTQDEFLNQNEFAEIKGSYDDYSFGDLIMVFQNPDSEECENKAVTFKQAELVFDEVLTVMTDEGVSKQQMKKERDSFLLSYLTLSDYQEQEDQVQQKKKKDPKKYQKLNKEIEKKKLNSNEKEQKEDIYKKREKSSYEKYLDFMKIYQKQEQELKFDEEEQQRLMEQKKSQGFLQEIGVEQNNQEGNVNGIQDPLKELMKVDVMNTNQFKKVKKQWSQGKFLDKHIIDEFDYEWISTNCPPKDFLTLIRFTVISKLARNGFLHCRQFVSVCGKFIFVLLKSNKTVIVRQAQLLKTTKQIELGYADLFSLEPVDDNFRPLRLKNYIKQINDDEVKKLLMDQQFSQTLIRRENINIDDHCKQSFNNLNKYNDIELRVTVIKKQQEIDKLLKFIVKDLNIDQSHEKVELINDSDLPRIQWEVYVIYLDYLIYYIDEIQHLKRKGHPELKSNLALLYKMAFRKALIVSNQYWYEKNKTLWRDLTQQNQIVQNLWGKLDVESVAPYTEFFQPAGDTGSAMWRKYRINENGVSSEFINMEKIKITHAIVLKNLNILKLISDQMCIAYFPIHDPYQLKGLQKELFFQALIDASLMKKFEATPGEIELQGLMELLKIKEELNDSDTTCLEVAAAFNYKLPWFIPITSIRDYFGEKIALYFNFVSFYIKQLWYMSIIGIITQGMMASSDESVRGSIIIIQSISIIVWSTFFIEYWKRQQVLFSVQYGQSNFEEDEAERPAFEGQYIRSIINDDLNEEFYSPFKRKMKQLLSLGVSFLIIGCVIGCVLAIFTFKSSMIEQGQPALIAQQVPAILNSAQIGIFNVIYQILVMFFNSYENHKILSSYENALIAKVFIFMFVNNFNSFFIIAFLEGYFKNLKLCSAGDGLPDNCFDILQNQMTVIFLTTFGVQIPKVLVPILKGYVMQKIKKVDINPEIHPFNLIDQALESQFELDPYQTNEEVDGTVLDYMELAIQFSYLCLFGLAFPSAYIMAFFSGILKLQVDKIKLQMYLRRPFPQGAATIGNWLVILEVITFFGIFSNAGLIVYTSQTIKENQIVIFSVLLVLFLAMKYFIRFLVPDSPESAIILNKRHQYIADKVIKGFTQSEQKQFIPARINLKVDGISYQQIHVFQQQDNCSIRNNEDYLENQQDLQY